MYNLIYLKMSKLVNYHSCLFQEFQTVYQQFFPEGDPSKFATFVFNVFDSDKVS